ncbi:MAG TPA: YdcF family protein [Terriglobales bacterium]|nr:YdcF family protein [Terriglobales bacterium]
MTKVRLILIVLAVAVVFFFLAGRLLLVDRPEHADAILVLAGETEVRPQKGLQLLQQGYAPSLIMDVEDKRIFHLSLPELAQRWEESLPQNAQMSVCTIAGLSTQEESQQAAQCLKRFNVHNVLVVTSDFHSRRALSIFQHELPGFHFSVAAAYNPTTFGTAWWTHREWAKTALYEWIRLLWWEAIDRWR